MCRSLGEIGDGLFVCRNNTGTGGTNIKPSVYYAISWDDLYSNRQVRRIRNGCETAGKTRDHKSIMLHLLFHPLSGAGCSRFLRPLYVSSSLKPHLPTVVLTWSRAFSRAFFPRRLSRSVMAALSESIYSSYLTVSVSR